MGQESQTSLILSLLAPCPVSVSKTFFRVKFRRKQPNAQSKKVFPTLSYPQARDGSGRPASSNPESLKWQSGNLADCRLLAGRRQGAQNEVFPYAPQPRPPVSGEVHSLGAQVLLLSPGAAS